MEELFKESAGYLALALEGIAVLVIAYGAIRALVGLFMPVKYDPRKPFAGKKIVWLGFGVWLLLGLEFELAADIVRTAISPSWSELGQLATIAAIRTFLNYFLEKDIEKGVVPETATEELMTDKEPVVSRSSMALKAE
jgi:uncharacterized membrane protein